MKRIFYFQILLLLLLQSNCSVSDNFKEEKVNEDIVLNCSMSLKRLSKVEKEDFYKQSSSENKLPNTVFFNKRDSILLV